MPRADMETTPRILIMYTVEQELAVDRSAAWIRLRSTVAMWQPVEDMLRTQEDAPEPQSALAAVEQNR